MTRFKLTGDSRLQRKLQTLSLETRNPTAFLRGPGQFRVETWLCLFTEIPAW